MSGLRFAILDDNEQDRALVAEELSRSFPDVHFIEVYDRQSFENLLAGGAFDVVITDYQLNWGSGLEVFAAVRKLFVDVPVIMFTGSGNEETAVRAMRSGLDDYIVKRASHYVRVPVSVRLALDRRQADREIHEQREWLSAILGSITEGVIVTDCDGHIRFLNPAAEKITGWNRELALGQMIEGVFELHGEDGSEIPGTPARRALRGDGEACKERDLVLTRRDGRRANIIDGACPLYDRQRQIAGAVVAFRDITERKRAQRGLERALEELEQFTYAAAHDLREPLRIVTTFTELLVREHEGELRPGAREVARHIVEGVQRMEALVTGLLEYGEVERAQLEIAEVHSASVLERVAKRLNSLIEETGTELSWENLPAVETDASQLAVVFRNLLLNAIRHRRTEAPRVTVTAEPKGGEWIFRVADNGIGIAPRHHQRIFGVFQRLDPDRHPGAGIGLTVSRRAVEKLGGRIWVESEEGRGSRFYFSLPRHARAVNA